MTTVRVISDIIVDTVIIAVAAYILCRVALHLRGVMTDAQPEPSNTDQHHPGLWPVLADARRITEEAAGGNHGVTG